MNIFNVSFLPVNIFVHNFFFGVGTCIYFWNEAYRCCLHYTSIEVLEANVLEKEESENKVFQFILNINGSNNFRPMI